MDLDEIARSSRFQTHYSRWLRRILRASFGVSTLIAASVSTSGSASATVGCPGVADRFKAILGITGDFDTRLRVERKSTNSEAQAQTFQEIVRGSVLAELGESATMRDRPSDPARELVTATIYPFSRAVQNALQARIRIREYGERPARSRDRFTSTSGDLVSLEIKAKTAQAGVVVKPILKVRKALLPDLFKDQTTFDARHSALERARLGEATNDPALVKEALATVAEFYAKSAELGEPLVADAIEYTREAWLVRLYNKSTGKLHSVQLTFDRAVGLRRGVDPTTSPWDVTAQPMTTAYPTGDKTVVVVEMKSDLVADAAYRSDTEAFARESAGYVRIRRAYEDLQASPAPGFAADSGKAAHLATESWE